MLAIVLTVLLFASQAYGKDERAWQTANIVAAEQPKLVVPGSWNPNVPHTYTVETRLERIKATEMVPAAGKRDGGPAMGPRRQPPMSFKVGEEVKIAIEEDKARSTRQPDLYILDSKRKEHVLTIDERVPKEKQDQ